MLYASAITVTLSIALYLISCSGFRNAWRETDKAVTPIFRSDKSRSYYKACRRHEQYWLGIMLASLGALTIGFGLLAAYYMPTNQPDGKQRSSKTQIIRLAAHTTSNEL